MRPHRSLRALMVDVPPSYAGVLAAHLADGGWKLEPEHADGADALSAALARRGWNAVLYGGDAPGAVPARKALALVRLADPHLPFVAVSPNIRRGDLASVIRGLADAMVVSDPRQLARALTKELDAARLRRRVGGAHHLLLAQQAIADDLAAGLEPGELCARVLSTLGETLGWSTGAVWRPAEDEPLLRCAAVWHAADAHADVVAFAEHTREQRFAPGQGMPGRVWAFRRPSWVTDLSSQDARTPRARAALRAGLMTAVAFPLAVGDDCTGVIEFFSRGVHESNGEVAAMFATVGGQVAQYLDRRRREDAESVRLHAALDRTRGFLDAAGALIVVLDGDGRVLLANARVCAAIGLREADLLGQDWFSLAVPKPGRAAARGAFEQLIASEAGALSHRLPSAGGERRTVAWHATGLDDGAGVLLFGHVDVVTSRAAVAAAG